MYPISEAYQTKMLDKVQTHRLTGTLDDTITFDDSDVIGVSYRNQCSDKNVLLGSVNIGTLKLTFLKDLLDRGDYYGKKITISDGLLLQKDPIVWTDVPVGVFYIGEAYRTGQGMIDVTAYDALSLMDKPLTVAQTNGKLYDFCKIIEDSTGAEFGMTQEECEALPNGNIEIAPYTDNDMTTWRDMVSELAQMIGGFAYADRTGKWRLKPFDNTSVLTIPVNRRMSGAKFSDFETRFDGLSYLDIKTTGELQYVGDRDGYVMNLGNNPFLQYGTPSAITSRVEAIFAKVQLMAYTPFEVSMLPAFIALDLGDVVSFSDDYTGDTSSGAVMALIWTYNKSVKVQCFGANPNLQYGQSKAEKAAQGAASSNKNDKISTFAATNIQEFEIGNEEREILRTYFSTSSEQPMLTLTEVKFNLEEPGEVQILYYLNNELIGYSPVETYSESGLHTMSVMYPMTGLATNFKHKFVVCMRTSTGLNIQPASARTYVQGFGADLTSKWLGLIEASDTIDLLDVGSVQPVVLVDGVVTHEWTVVTAPSISDTVDVLPVSSVGLLPFTETVNAYLENAYYATEDLEFYLATEDDEYLETE